MMQFAVIGDPIAHSLSPLLHQEIYRQLDIDASFKKIQLKLDSLASFMTQNKLDGFNVTVPYKQSVIPFLDELDESARTIGAVNCVHHGKGHNTDWVGFLKAMDINDIVLEGMDCIILGAGGAARAVAYALIQAGVKSISVQNRTREKGNQLKKKYQHIIFFRKILYYKFGNSIVSKGNSTSASEASQIVFGTETLKNQFL